MKHRPPDAVREPNEATAEDLRSALRNGLEELADDVEEYEVAMRVRQTGDAMTALLEADPSERRSHMKDAQNALQRAARAADESQSLIDMYWNALLTYKQKRRNGEA